MTRSILPVLAALTIFIGTGCGPSTKLVQSWRDPGTTLQQGQYKKLLCIALVQDESNRRIAEDKLVSLMPGNAVQSYNYLGPLPDSLDRRKTNERLSADGIDGVVIMRLARKEKETTYVPGSYPYPYHTYGGYYGYAMPYYADPGYIRTDNYYFIETNLYDVAKDKLVWTGMTSSWEPSSVARVVEDVVKAVHAQMKAEGFIAVPAKP